MARVEKRENVVRFALREYKLALIFIIQCVHERCVFVRVCASTEFISKMYSQR